MSTRARTTTIAAITRRTQGGMPGAVGRARLMIGRSPGVKSVVADEDDDADADADVAAGDAAAPIRVPAATSVAAARIGTGGCSTVTGVSAPEEGSCDGTGGAASLDGEGSGIRAEVAAADADPDPDGEATEATEAT
jgi:hypothetical protein